MTDLLAAIEQDTEAIIRRVEQKLNERPQIIVREELVPVTDEAVAALAASDHGLFLRERLLVQVARAETAERFRWLKRPPGGPVILEVEVDALQDRLDRAAHWVKQVGKKDVAPARPPEWVARQIKARLGLPFPYLTGVIEAPTLRPDGTVLETPGYDEAMGLLYVPSTDYHPGPTVTAAEAKAALLDPVCDFPFVNPNSRAAYVAAVLSIVARHAILGPVPAFAIRAPTPGSGKGLLSQIISHIGTSRDPAVTTYPGDETEMRKRILTFALEGTAVVLLDNLSGVLGSDQLAAALTACEWQDRLLGVSRLVRAPLFAVWLLTGNNLRFGQTMGRRILPIDLDPGVEHPEDRTGFRYPDVVGRVRVQRPTLVLAALALLRGYIAEGQPSHGKPRVGSFEAWDDLIRGACIWAGLEDPAATDDPESARGRIRAEGDDDLETIDTLLSALADAFGADDFQTSDVVKRSDTDLALKEALKIGAADKKGNVTALSIGYQFRAIQNRVVHGRKIVKVRSRGQKSRAWCVEAGGGQQP